MPLLVISLNFTMDMEEDPIDVASTPSPPPPLLDYESSMSTAINDWTIRLRAALATLPSSNERFLRLKFLDGLQFDFVY
jgi:hypothetical protein